MARFLIHQYHYAARPKDAVTNHMRLIRKALAEVGIGGEIFAHDVKPRGSSSINRFDAERVGAGDLLLLHHSHGNPKLDLVLKANVQKALVYHNVTPPEYFSYDPHMANLCRLGREQLWRMRKEVRWSFGVSNTNVFELKMFGFPRLQALPLLDLSETMITSDTEKFPEKTVLFVGRHSPHKNQALLIKSFYYLRQMMEGPMKLVLVGPGDPVYKNYLKLLAKGLGIVSAVDFKTQLDEGELKSLYRRSHVYLSASLHEGFGVPLVEAMAHSLPVVAWPATGVKETLGKSGVQLKSVKPLDVAASLKTFFENERIRKTVLKSQRMRFRQLKRFQNRLEIQRKLTVLKDEISGAAQLSAREV